jgi:hypothetical protein
MEGTQKNEVSLKSLSLVTTSAHFSYVYKKTEKLVTAIYMITNFIKDNEPLKWKFRDNALKLLSLNRAFTNVSLSERKGLINEYQGIALEVVSLSGVASLSGLISTMNADVLSREFTALVSVLEKEDNKKANDETVVLEPGFFQVAQPSVQPVNESVLYESRPVTSVQTVQAQTQPRAEGFSDKGHAVSPVVTPVVAIHTDKSEPKEKAVKSPEPKDSRQAIIIKILSKKGGLNIKDFADSIKGVSVKTIQRELLSMVASGVLKKEGERRWSTYSLAS